MTVTTFATATSLGALPRVNLLPPEIAEQRRLRQAKVAMAAGLVGCVAVAGVLYTAAHSSVSSAQADLDSATQQKVALQAQVARLANVTATFAQVQARQAMLTQAMGDEVQWSHFLNDLALTMPANVWLTNVTIAQTGTAPTTAPASAGVAVFDAGIGSVTFTGVAMSHDDVAAWLETLAREKGYANAYFTSSNEVDLYGHTVVTFTSSVTVTPAAYSGRFTKPAGS
jgi:Tfp pilus assembly protein PilN